MVKIFSYDVFDTCLIRRCAVPTDVFAEVVRRWGRSQAETAWVQNFVAARITAEQRARAVGAEEVTLTEIWQQLARMIADVDPATGVGLELAVEREWIRPNRAMLARVRGRRAAGIRILFTSDTSMPAEFIREQLMEHGFFEPGDGLYVSSEFRATKRTGALFRCMLEREGLEPREICHCGDDPARDGRVPKRMGLRIEFVRETRLAGAEFALVARAKGCHAALHRLAGAMREARLGAGASGRPVAAEVVAGFVGPFILTFASWVLERARQDGIRRLYFLSRDGYLLHRACRLLLGDPGDIDCRYLQVSRQSLLLPSLETVTPGGIPWLRRSTETPRLGHLLAKLELSLSEAGLKFQRLAGGAGESRLLETDDDWYLFWEALQEREVQERILARRTERRAAALTYFQQVGLGDSVDYAVVDLGWFLSGQRALSQLLRGGGLRSPVKGYYLGLETERYGPVEAGAAEALFYRNAPDLNAALSPDLLFTHAPSLLEHMIGCAPNGTVLCYWQMPGGDSAPRYAPVLESTGRAYKEIETACLRFVANNRDLTAELGNDGIARTALSPLIEEFTRNAPLSWIEYLAQIEAAIDQNNRDAQSLTEPYRVRDIVGAAFAAIRGRQRTALLRHWEQGSRLRSGRFARLLFDLAAWSVRAYKRRRRLRP